MSARYREGAGRVRRRVLRSFKIYLNPKYFWALNFLDTNNFGYKLFTQDFLDPMFFGHKVSLGPNILLPIFSWTRQFSDTKLFLEHGRSSQDRSSLDRSSQDKPSQDSSSKDTTSQDRSMEDRSSWDGSSYVRSSSDRSSQDRSSQDKLIQDKSSYEVTTQLF